MPCQVRAVLRELVHLGELSKAQVERGLPLIEGLLRARRGRPPKATSAKKLKVGKVHEYAMILKDFADRQKKCWQTRPLRLHTLFRLLALSPYFGLRPCEWLNVWIDDGRVFAMNAKRPMVGGEGRSDLSKSTKLPPTAPELVEELVFFLKDAPIENWGQLAAYAWFAC